MARATASLLMFLACAIGSSASAAEVDQAFNLTCTGTERTLAPSLLKDENKPYTSIYRIDLDAQKWCSGTCKSQADIVRVSPIVIVLEEKAIDTPRQHENLLNQISRETGAHLSHAESGIGPEHLAIFWRGQCEKSPFTGFPKVETKF